MFHRKHPRVTLDCGDEMITKQAHKAECDIHNILKQYQRTGILTHVAASRPRYEDLPDTLDYQSALNSILAADQAFAALPAKLRDHFRNDPAAFLAAFTDPAQEGFLREHGLIHPKSDTPAEASQKPADAG